MNQRTIDLISGSVLSLPLFKKNIIPWVQVAIINWHPVKNSKNILLELYPDQAKIFESLPEYRQENRRGYLAIFYYNPGTKSDLFLLINKLFETSRRFKKIYLISQDPINHGLDNVYWIKSEPILLEEYSLFSL